MTEPTLPYDYTRCANDVCPRRQQCLRYLAPWGERQSFAAFTCIAPRWDHYIPVDRDAR